MNLPHVLSIVFQFLAIMIVNAIYLRSQLLILLQMDGLLNGNIHPHAMGSGLITHLLYLNINHYQANWEPARKVLL